jgi:hypothetical protein
VPPLFPQVGITPPQQPADSVCARCAAAPAQGSRTGRPQIPAQSSTTRQSRAMSSPTTAGSRPTYWRESSHEFAERKWASAARGIVFRRAEKKESTARSGRDTQNSSRSGWRANSAATQAQRSHTAPLSIRAPEKFPTPRQAPIKNSFLHVSEWVARRDLARVVMDDPPSLRKALEYQRKNSTDISLLPGQVPMSQDKRSART